MWGYGNYEYPMMGYGYGNGFEHIFFSIFWIVVIVVGIVVLVRLVRHGKPMRWCSHHDSALNLLKERYVKGEISKEEFEEKKRVILS